MYFNLIRRAIMLALALILFQTSSALAGFEEGTVFTLWPLIDYRSSPQTSYHSTHILGPLIKYERKETEYDFALRPLWYRASDPTRDVSLNEILFPLHQRTHSTDSTKSVTLGLFRSESSPDERSFSLFPIIFYRDSDVRGDEMAFFPIGGHLENRLGRRNIDFVLFPIYSKTKR